MYEAGFLTFKCDPRFPTIPLKIGNKVYDLLLDTGANCSVLPEKAAPKGNIQKEVIGVTGTPERHYMSTEGMASLGPLSFEHSFLLMNGNSLSLFGRDLLVKLRAQIFCQPDGIVVKFPLHQVHVLAGLDAVNIVDLPERLQNEVNPIVWGGKNSVGLVKSAPLLSPVVKEGQLPPAQRQYPLKPEAIQGLAPIIDEFLKQGILVPCVSVCNTPILAIRKKQMGSDGKPVYRMVQDLRLINQYVIPCYPVVPDPSVIISRVPSNAQYYSVIDLANAYFSIKVDPEKRYLFAFTWGQPGVHKGASGVQGGSQVNLPGQLTWTRMPMGYVEAPAVFSRVLAHDLMDVELPQGSILLHYVDDLLLASQSREDNEVDSIYLLNQLALKGHKVNPAKLQWAKQEVKFLGYALGPGVRRLDAERVKMILDIPFPTTKRGMRGFLGIIGFCRQWIIASGELLKPLQALIHNDAEEPLTPNAEQLRVFNELKMALSRAPALGIPSYEKTFDLFVHEHKGIASGVLTQEFGGSPRPVAYLSAQLDCVAKGLPGCLRNVAAAALLVEKAQDIVLGHTLVVHTPHDVASLLNSKHHKHLTNQRLSKYEITLLMTHGVTLKRCSTLNPASLLPREEGHCEYAHNCLQAVDMLSTPRPDLTDIPLKSPDLELFVDGSAFFQNGKRFVGFAVTTQDKVLIQKALAPGASAQLAELMALIAACKYAKGRRVNIWTDSKYCFSLCHFAASIWKERGFITSSGAQVAHGKEIAELLEVIHLPKEIALMHCRAHTKQTDFVSLGNKFADCAAKKAALHEVQAAQMVTPISEWQKQAPEVEKAKWEKWGIQPDAEGIWKSGDRLVLPRGKQYEVLQKIHTNTHMGAEKMAEMVLRQFVSPGIHEVAKRVARNCHYCQQCNPKGKTNAPPGGRPWAYRPMQHLQLDFTELAPAEGKKYLLLLICQLSGWVEGFALRKNDSTAVCKILLNEIFPRFGPPEILDSDQGSHFTAKVCKQLTETVGTKWAYHTPWHPASSGQVERQNATLKGLLTKLCMELNMKWTKILPLALYIVRTVPNKRTKLSPYELLFGHVPPALTPLTSLPKDYRNGDFTEETYKYLRALQKHLLTLQKYAAQTQSLPVWEAVHCVSPGDYVWVRTYKKTSLSPKWEGPFQVVLISPTAIRVKEIPAWIHHTRVKRSTATRACSEEAGSPEIDDNLRGSNACPSTGKVRPEAADNKEQRSLALTEDKVKPEVDGLKVD